MNHRNDRSLVYDILNYFFWLVYLLDVVNSLATVLISERQMYH